MNPSRWIASALLAVLAALSATDVAAAEPTDYVIYVGAGPSRSEDIVEGVHTPFSLGLLRLSGASDSVFGLDVAGEGIRLDSTWGQARSVKQSSSINLLLGRNLSRSASSRLDAALLIGLRQKTADCPAPYVGYQCYVDRDPGTSYALNVGVLLAWTQQRFMLGIRATGESVQGLVGLSF